MSRSPCQDICPDSSMECCAVKHNNRPLVYSSFSPQRRFGFIKSPKEDKSGEHYYRAMLRSHWRKCYFVIGSVDLITDNKCVRVDFARCHFKPLCIVMCNFHWAETKVTVTLLFFYYIHLAEGERQHDTVALWVKWLLFWTCFSGHCEVRRMRLRMGLEL